MMGEARSVEVGCGFLEFWRWEGLGKPVEARKRKPKLVRFVNERKSGRVESIYEL